MSIRIAAIGVSHWHSLYDAAYLRRLARMPDVHLVGLHDPDLQIAAHRAAAVGNPPIFTEYAQMLDETHPYFFLALGDHRSMAATAHYLLDHGYPFLMEKPMGYNASQVRSVAEKAAATRGFAAVSLPQRLQPFATQARQMLAEGRFGPLSHLYIRLNRPTLGALSRLGLALDARPRALRRRLPAQPRPARSRRLSVAHRRIR